MSHVIDFTQRPKRKRAELGTVDGRLALTDTGNAERFAKQHGERLRYVASWDRWIVYNGKVWIVDDGPAVAALAKQTVRDLHVEASNAAGDESTAIAKWAYKSESRRAREALVSLARAEAGIAISHEALDADHWALNVENGTLNLRTGELREHCAADLITKIAPVVYDASATAPTWEAFLQQMLGSELVAFLQRFFGYALTGETRDHVLVFNHGNGANGKTTATRTIGDMLGGYAIKAAPSLLFRSGNSERHPTEVAAISGARLVLCNEVDEGRAFDEALVKDLTGGDRITARRMREDFWTFTPTHKLLLSGNHRPRVRGTDDGIWRRIRLVPWSVTIPKEKQDARLLEKLRAEWPGILAWCVRGCLEWQTSGLGEPPAVRAATAAYRRDSDDLGPFFDEACVFTPDAKTSRKDFRAGYERWAEERGEHAIGAKRLAVALRDRNVRGGKVRTANGPRDGWLGVRLRDERDADAEDERRQGEART